MGYCPCPAATRRAQLALVTGQSLQTNPQGLAGALTRGGVPEAQARSAPGAGGHRAGFAVICAVLLTELPGTPQRLSGEQGHSLARPEPSPFFTPSPGLAQTRFLAVRWDLFQKIAPSIILEGSGSQARAMLHPRALLNSVCMRRASSHLAWRLRPGASFGSWGELSDSNSI